MAPKKTAASKSTPSLSGAQPLSIQSAASSSSNLAIGHNSPTNSPSHFSTGSGSSGAFSREPFSATAYQEQLQWSDTNVNGQFNQMLLEMGVPESIRKKQASGKTIQEKVR